MYNFVFYLIYSQQKQKNRSDAFSRYNGSLIVAFAMIVHIALILSLYRKIFLPVGEGYGSGNNKLQLTVIVMSVLLAAYLYYNQKRTEQIIKKYDGNLLPVNAKNVIVLVIIIFIPLIIGMMLSIKPE